MSKIAKTLDRILRGNADANIRFGDLCTLLNHLGFIERVRGDHHIFAREGIAEILNLQPLSGKVKVYQVKQVRAVIVSHGLAGESGDDSDDSGEDVGDETGSDPPEEGNDKPQ